MATIRKMGASKMYSFLKKASTAFALGDIVTVDGSGLLIPATSTSTVIVGVIKRAVLTTDADYAQSVPVAVEVFTQGDVFEIDASSTVTQAMVGVTKDLTNASTLNVAANAVAPFRVIGIGSTSTKALVVCIKNIFAI